MLKHVQHDTRMARSHALAVLPRHPELVFRVSLLRAVTLNSFQGLPPSCCHPELGSGSLPHTVTLNLFQGLQRC